MIAGAVMGKKKKLNVEPPPEPATEADDEGTIQVRLSGTFQQRLKRVAKNEGMSMGALIEDKMKQFVNSEWIRLWHLDKAREAEAVRKIEKELGD